MVEEMPFQYLEFLYRLFYSYDPNGQNISLINTLYNTEPYPHRIIVFLLHFKLAICVKITNYLSLKYTRVTQMYLPNLHILQPLSYFVP